MTARCVTSLVDGRVADHLEHFHDLQERMTGHSERAWLWFSRKSQACTINPRKRRSLKTGNDLIDPKLNLVERQWLKRFCGDTTF